MAGVGAAKPLNFAMQSESSTQLHITLRLSHHCYRGNGVPALSQRRLKQHQQV